MIGIESFGGYVPLYRFSRETLGQYWGKPTIPGEKAVANADEDSITMAVEAVVDCLGDLDRATIDGLFFATTSPAYLEKQNSSIIAAAADLSDQISTVDFGHSLRGASSAVTAALDAVTAGSRRRVLVATAECRLPAPDSDFEVQFGDGAASLIIGTENVVAQIEGRSSVSSEFMDVWRRAGDRFHNTWEDRFIVGEGYLKIARRTIAAFLEQQGRGVGDYAKVVLNALDTRSHVELARSLRVDPNQLQDPLYSTVGNAGTASSTMMLVAALQEAKPGDRILWANYADGCDVFSLLVTPAIERARVRRGINGYLASKLPMESYGKYSHFRGLMEWEPERRPPDQSSLTVLWRERAMILRCYGSKCRHCGEIQYPMQRVCPYCHTQDDYETVRLSHRRGRLFTFGMDQRAMTLDLPNVVAIVDLDGGGRYYTAVTDRDPRALEVGQTMELTLRKVHEGHRILNYAWKARPVRE